MKLRQLLLGVVGVSCGLMGCAGADFEPTSASEDDFGALESIDEADELGTLEQALCENKGGTNAVMTGLAVAAGRELRRWSPERDFQWNSSKGMLELSSAGLARCGGSTVICNDLPPDTTYTCAQQAGWGKCNESWMVGMCNASCGRCTGGGGGSCSNTQALLDMQKPEANGKVSFPGNIKLDSTLLKSQLKTNWTTQASCNSSGSCSAPDHDLKFLYSEAGSCDKKFFFNPLKVGTTTRLSATDTDKLKNKLQFLGYPSNKMLNFYIRNGEVSVDPTYGLNEGASSTVGSCDAACTKVTSTDVSGRCCSCNGASKKYSRATFNANTYLCL